jgi:hypothetical protein
VQGPARGGGQQRDPSREPYDDRAGLRGLDAGVGRELLDAAVRQWREP